MEQSRIGCARRGGFYRLCWGKSPLKCLLEMELNWVLQDSQDILFAGGSLALSDNTPGNVLQYAFNTSSWTVVGSASGLPGPVTAIEVNDRNASSVFAAGQYVSFFSHQIRYSSNLLSELMVHHSFRTGMARTGPPSVRIHLFLPRHEPHYYQIRR